MNVLDNLLLIILVVAFLMFLYRKKKFPFAKKDKELEKQETPETAQSSAPHNQNMAFMPQMYPYGIQGYQNPYGNIKGGAPLTAVPESITLCRLIPWTFQFDPLPFTDSAEQDRVTDNMINADVPQLGATIDGEIRALNAEGYTITGITATALPLGDYATRVLFCITCTGNAAPGV